MPSRTPLIIPSEIQSREFDAKLLIACVAAERGFESVVGSRNDIHMAIDRLPRSIYLGKDVRHSSDRISGILRKLGHTIVSLDEEAQFYYTRETYRRARVSGPALRATAALMAWGPDNAQAWKESAHYHGVPIHVTGNARFDLMRPELRGFFAAETEALKAKYGRFILINTNFGSINFFYPGAGPNPPPPPEKPADDAPFQTRVLFHRHGIFRGFLDAIPAIAAAFPQHALIVRPHPAENHGTWQAAADGFRNVHVLHEGPIFPWLMASDAVIHNGCTTGLESYVLGAKPIAYRPLAQAELDLELPNAVSVEAFDQAGLLRALDDAVADRPEGDAERARARRALFDRHIAAIDGPLAAERIVAVVDEIERHRAHHAPPPLADRIAGVALARWRTLQKQRRAHLPNHKNNVDYTRHRFPGLSLEAVEERVSRLARLLGRFSQVRVWEIERDFIFGVGRA